MIRVHVDRHRLHQPRDVCRGRPDLVCEQPGPYALADAGAPFGCQVQDVPGLDRVALPGLPSRP